MGSLYGKELLMLVIIIAKNFNMIFIKANVEEKPGDKFEALKLKTPIKNPPLH